MLVVFGHLLSGCGGENASEESRQGSAVTYGINIQGLVYEQPPQTWARQLDAVTAAGLTLVRADAAWDVVEPRPPVEGRHRYDWRLYDRLVTLLAERRLRWLPIIDYSTRWNRSDPGNRRSPPADLEAYAEYAAAVARRYGQDGEFWRSRPQLPAMPVTAYEIWNEPDFRPTAFPAARYVDAYLAARNRIVAADPAARVWVGGLAIDPGGFIRAMLRQRPDAASQIDAVAIHPYGDNAVESIRKVARLREDLDDLDLGEIPIAVTEVGWATQGDDPLPRASDARRARYLTELVRTLGRSDARIVAFVPHAWVTLEQNPDRTEQWFGIRHPDGTPTATSAAYARAVRDATAVR